MRKSVRFIKASLAQRRRCSGRMTSWRQPKNRLANDPPSYLSRWQDASDGSSRRANGNTPSSACPKSSRQPIYCLHHSRLMYLTVQQEPFPAFRQNTCGFFLLLLLPPKPTLLNQFVFRLINFPRCLQSTRWCWKFHPENSKSCYFMPRSFRKTSLSSYREDKGHHYPSSLVFLGYD